MLEMNYKKINVKLQHIRGFILEIIIGCIYLGNFIIDYIYYVKFKFRIQNSSILVPKLRSSVPGQQRGCPDK